MTGFRDRVGAICARLPGAEWADPADGKLPSWKVGNKMFACFGGASPGVSVRVSDSATSAMLIEAGIATKAAYFPATWVRLPEDCAEDELIHRLHTSYNIVRSGLTKKVQAALATREDA